jgi:hypothetical protein
MTYKTFYDVFLSEMPQRLNGSNDFAAQVEMIRENLRYNDDVSIIGPGIFKTQNGTQVTYWVGDAAAGNVQLIVDTEEHGSFRKVAMTSKNPDITPGSPPFASDLYVLIKEDSNNNNLVFASDEFLSDGGIKLWQGMVSKGYKIAVFDTSTGKYVLSQVANVEELAQYLGAGDSRKYVFVMAESIQNIRGVMHSFAIMELKRKAGYPLFEQFCKK